MNEKSPTFWETEGFRWQQMKNLIKSLENEPGIPELYSLARDERYSVAASPPEDRDFETNLFTEFEQFDGCKIDIQRETIGELTIIHDATFYDPAGRAIFGLSEIIPEGYTIIEGGFIGRDFVNPTFKCIVVQPGFLESIGGRLCLIHEVGHSADYARTPQSRKEYLDHLKGWESPEREDEAWKHARQILIGMKQRDLQFFPEWFEKTELEKWVKFCKENHSYPEMVNAA